MFNYHHRSDASECKLTRSFQGWLRHSMKAQAPKPLMHVSSAAGNCKGEFADGRSQVQASEGYDSAEEDDDDGDGGKQGRSAKRRRGA